MTINWPWTAIMRFDTHPDTPSLHQMWRTPVIKDPYTKSIFLWFLFVSVYTFCIIGLKSIEVAKSGHIHVCVWSAYNDIGEARPPPPPITLWGPVSRRSCVTWRLLVLFAGACRSSASRRLQETWFDRPDVILSVVNFTRNQSVSVAVFE